MPQVLTDKTIFSLLEVSSSIKRSITQNFPSAFWIKAEMHKLNLHPPSGHCFPSMVEKQNGVIVARLDATIWRSNYFDINQKFLQTLHEPLKDGINILFLARVTYEPQHGLKLQIIDIDPSFSLGELEKEKNETIQKLKEKNLFNKNKTLQLPLLPQRIAVISASNSKGYSDFVLKIESNDWNYKFFHMVFTATLQGERAVTEIISQLRRIKMLAHHFDAVAIIRGGGAEVGLSCYNHLDLCTEIAYFPLPVLTGIGHSTNETVAESIAFKNAITPTDLADFLLQQFHNFSVTVTRAQNSIFNKAVDMVNQHKSNIKSTARLANLIIKNSLDKYKSAIVNSETSITRESRFLCQQAHATLKQYQSTLKTASANKLNTDKQQLRIKTAQMQNVVQNSINQQQNKISWQLQAIRKDLKIIFNQKAPLIETCKQAITIYSKTNIRQEKSRLNNIEEKIKAMDPVNVLRRGYSITLVNGQLLKTVQQVNQEDILQTITIDGTVTSIAQTKNQTHD
jgi:exodeoxyribonuclease VII large subunit